MVMNKDDFIGEMIDNIGKEYEIYILGVNKDMIRLTRGVIDKVFVKNNTLYIELKDNKNLEKFTLDNIDKVERYGNEYKVCYLDDSFFIIKVE